MDTPAGVAARCRSYGTDVLISGDTLVESSRRLQQDDRGYWDLSTFKEPYRVEGKKTMGLELAEQLGWSLPDWIVYPTGGGTGIVAMDKAFQELRALGLIGESRCRFAVVQMAGCAPVVRAFERGEEEVEPWQQPETEVWGLRVPRTIADFLILRAVRASGGTALTVAEESIAAMQSRAAHEEGLLVGPEGAAALLAVERLMANGEAGDGASVLIFQTGHPGNYL